MKNKRGFGKTLHFRSWNSLFLMFGICQMVLWLIGLLLDHFDPQNKLKCQNSGEIKWAFICKTKYFKYPSCSLFLACCAVRAPISLNIYETFMIGCLFFSVCIKVYKNSQFNVKANSWPNKMLLENAKLSLSKGNNWILMVNSYASTPRARKTLGISIFNS